MLVQLRAQNLLTLAKAPRLCCPQQLIAGRSDISRVLGCLGVGVFLSGLAHLLGVAYCLSGTGRCP